MKMKFILTALLCLTVVGAANANGYYCKYKDASGETIESGIAGTIEEECQWYKNFGATEYNKCAADYKRIKSGKCDIMLTRVHKKGSSQCEVSYTKSDNIKRSMACSGPEKETIQKEISKLYNIEKGYALYY